jgi:hypothetical protein
MEAVYCVWALTKFFILLNNQLLLTFVHDLPELFIFYYIIMMMFEIYTILLIYVALRPRVRYHYIPMCFFNFLSFAFHSIYYFNTNYFLLFIIIILYGYELYMLYYCSKEN